MDDRIVVIGDLKMAYDRIYTGLKPNHLENVPFDGNYELFVVFYRDSLCGKFSLNSLPCRYEPLRNTAFFSVHGSDDDLRNAYDDFVDIISPSLDSGRFTSSEHGSDNIFKTMEFSQNPNNQEIYSLCKNLENNGFNVFIDIVYEVKDPLGEDFNYGSLPEENNLISARRRYNKWPVSSSYS